MRFIKNFKKVCINEKLNVDQAIASFNKEGEDVLIVTNKRDHFKGIITAGDLRKFLIARKPVSSPLSEITNSNPLMMSGVNDVSSLSKAVKLNHKYIPIVQKNMILILIDLKQTFKINTNPVLIMAGGFGKRLGELTKNTPKPILKIGNEILLEKTLKDLRQQGFYNIFISVHFKAEKIKKLIADGNQFGLNVSYLEEKNPLGTAGAISMIPKEINDALLIINGDLLVDIDLNEVVNFHKKFNQDVTICAKEYTHKVNFGVIELSRNLVKRVSEKPTIKFPIAVGINMVSKSARDLIKINTKLDMPDFYNIVNSKKKKIKMFLFKTKWLDIGTPENFEIAQKDLGDY